MSCCLPSGVSTEALHHVFPACDDAGIKLGAQGAGGTFDEVIAPEPDATPIAPKEAPPRIRKLMTAPTASTRARAPQYTGVCLCIMWNTYLYSYCVV